MRRSFCAPFAQTRVRTRRLRLVGPSALTPAQLRVAKLAAAGLTNQQIAEKLWVTVKTVETHLAASFKKLGVASRGQLPDALGEPEPLAAAAA